MGRYYFHPFVMNVNNDLDDMKTETYDVLNVLKPLNVRRKNHQEGNFFNLNIFVLN